MLIGLTDKDLIESIEPWRWLTSEHLSPFLVTVLGDVMLNDANGEVFFPCSSSGRLTLIAVNTEEFWRRAADPENFEEWFGASLVAPLRDIGVKPRGNQCLGQKILAILGGSYEPDNYATTDVSIQLSLLGDIHKQIEDLPDGARIESVVVE